MISALPPIDESSNSQAIAPLQPIPELINDLPNLCGWETDLEQVRQDQRPVFLEPSSPSLKTCTAAFAVALHMHQPMVPSQEPGHLISHLQYMFEHPFDGDNHRAGTFTYCYSRIANFMVDLINQGYSPRVMLSYSGTLLWGLRQMGRGDVLDNLKRITTEKTYQPYVEWLGTFWGHAIAPTIPAADFKLHIQAWQHHFAAIFGWEALRRVRGFCLPELQLPTEPNALYTLVQTLQETGYHWLLVRAEQVCTSERQPLSQVHLPHRLEVTNTQGQTLSMAVLVQPSHCTAESLASMEPYRQAQQLARQPLGDRLIPPLVTQIEDGENTHAMMHDFPAAFRNTWYDVLNQGDRSVQGLTGTEYLELLQATGLGLDDYPVCQVMPSPSTRPDVPHQRLHQRFHHAIAAGHRPPLAGHRLSESPRYRKALLYYLLSQTSCFQHWSSESHWQSAWQGLYQQTDALLRQGF